MPQEPSSKIRVLWIELLCILVPGALAFILLGGGQEQIRQVMDRFVLKYEGWWGAADATRQDVKLTVEKLWVAEQKDSARIEELNRKIDDLLLRLNNASQSK